MGRNRGIGPSRAIPDNQYIRFKIRISSHRFTSSFPAPLEAASHFLDGRSQDKRTIPLEELEKEFEDQ
jgi:hypothetical protein